MIVWEFEQPPVTKGNGATIPQTASHVVCFVQIVPLIEIFLGFRCAAGHQLPSYGRNRKRAPAIGEGEEKEEAGPEDGRQAEVGLFWDSVDRGRLGLARDKGPLRLGNAPSLFLQTRRGGNKPREGFRRNQQIHQRSPPIGEQSFFYRGSRPSFDELVNTAIATRRPGYNSQSGREGDPGT